MLKYAFSHILETLSPYFWQLVQHQELIKNSTLHCTLINLRYFCVVTQTRKPFSALCRAVLAWVAAPGVMCTSSVRRLHVIRTSSTFHLRMHICCPHQDTSSAHCLQAICTTPHGHRGPELSFTVTGICYWMEFVAGMLNCFISGSCKWFAR